MLMARLGMYSLFISLIVIANLVVKLVTYFAQNVQQVSLVQMCFPGKPAGQCLHQLVILL